MSSLRGIFTEKYEDHSEWRTRQVVSPFSVLSISTWPPSLWVNYMLQIVSRRKCTFCPTVLSREPREYFYHGTYIAVADLAVAYTAYTVRMAEFLNSKQPSLDRLSRTLWIVEWSQVSRLRGGKILTIMSEYHWETREYLGIGKYKIKPIQFTRHSI